MSAKPAKDASQEANPPEFAASNPPAYRGSTAGYDFYLQTICEIQKSIGGLTTAVQTLAKDATENETELRKISQDVHTTKTIMMFCAWAILVVGVLHEIWHPLLDFLVSHTSK
jgi:hypothetical protein